MADTYSNILLHVVAATKMRTPWIVEDVAEPVYRYIGGVIRNSGGVLYEIGGMPDHVHMLLRWKPGADISSLNREWKSESSGWIHRTWPGLREFRWQTGGGIFSVSQSQAGKVAEYIRNQRDHHRSRTFEEEYREFLTANGIDFDEAHLFD